MKKIVFIFVLSLFCSFAFAQKTTEKPDKGIKFFKGTWAELLAEAKKTKKPFFVDVYTTWCGPCKMMSKLTFTDETVGKYSNDNFIAYKIDAEDGEGIKVADDNKVRAYPTILFFNTDGKRIGKEEAYMDAERFLYVMEKYTPKSTKK